MLDINEALYDYIMDSAPQITDRWASLLYDYKNSIYAEDAGDEMRAKLRKQHRMTIETVASAILGDEEQYNKNVKVWVDRVANSRVKTNTPIHEVLKAVGKSGTVIWEFIETFTELHRQHVTPAMVIHWSKNLHRALDEVNNKFTRFYYELIDRKIKSQREEIHKTSSPVIPIMKGIGVFPLVGQISERRADLIIQYIPQVCKEKDIEILFIDLSGTSFTETYVREKLRQMVGILHMLGIDCAVSGLRPDSVMILGGNRQVQDIPFYNSLQQALAHYGLTRS
ncbi:rsbT co-antagonist protein RsbR [Terribacillus halophilus]|uniref:RsbT co-antagonist protein RsbR n=1 Tax=Terribacillus halophilus TaxID=361279 RepID=A0A1G6RH15_9BACI|nr:STAS domain-containing protein [Terribacillus halophilus]SDD03644.1 rsbT co-antagonist protein RsbR [Terribacillus halophilus]